MRRIGCLALAFALTISLALAQAGVNLSYKGRLLDADGTPITTATPAQFAVCLGGDPAAMGSCGGGTVSYNETATINPDADGVFNYLIGTGTHMPPDLDLALYNTTQPLYLEVTLNGETVLPRKLLVLNQDTAASASFLLESIAAAGTRGIVSTTESEGGVAIRGMASATSGTGSAIRGENRSATTFATAVYGFTSATTGGTIAVRGDNRSSGDFALGVYGFASATSGLTGGVRGDCASTNCSGVYGFASATSGFTSGGRFDARSPLGTGGFFLNSGGGDVIQGWGNSGQVFRVANNGDLFVRGRRITGNSVAVCQQSGDCRPSCSPIYARGPCTVTSDTGACSASTDQGSCCVCPGP
jgi:hypothetical protein